MKALFKKRAILLMIAVALLFTSLSEFGTFAANVVETEGLQLQTILIDNNGKNWTTLSWGGATMTPNTNWTTLTIHDYYENGKLNFDVINNGTGEVSFKIGLVSKEHGESTTILWTNMDKYKGAITASTEWSSYSLPIKELVDAFPDSGFSLDNFWYVYVGSVPSGTTLSFQNVSITSTDDERQYQMIKVDQVGYVCDGTKTARVSYFEKFGSLNGKTYEIVDAESEEVVITGTLSDGVLDETFSGEVVHIINFDELTEPGTYYIRIRNAELDASVRSPRDVEEDLDMDTLTSVRFNIGNDVYDDLLLDLTKYYYYQRQGIEIEEEYAGEFARENLHPDDIAVKRWSDRNNPDAQTFDVSGGWYDAGDYGKYTSNSAGTIDDLLLAYELYPEVLNSIEMNIPETDPDNPLYVDAPGILSEIKYELDMLLKLEHNSKDGSFYVAANYNDGVIYLEDTLYQSTTHESDESERDLRSHLATVDMAAVLAHAYIVYKDIPVYADFAEQCLETAIRAWSWANDPANEKHMSIGAANRTYTFTDVTLQRNMYWAAGALYRATSIAGLDNSEYEAFIVDNCEQDNMTYCFTSASVSYSHNGRAFLGYYHYLYNNESPDTAVEEVFSMYDSWRTRMLRYDCWGIEYPSWGFWWGSNKMIANSAMTFIMGDIISQKSEEERQDAVTAVENAFHYMLGLNPISFSYVSGYGENSVENIFSAIYSSDAKLDPYKCPDGYFTEGANDTNNPHLSKFTGKCYIDSDGEFTTNENTIYGNAAMIYLTAAMMSENASENVIGDVDSDGDFDTQDIAMMQYYLNASGDLNDWQAGDLSQDSKIDVVDLCMMKRMI
ncbi:MAG: glycoside hydrolase family 9 protein [Oscillospiraceae bacterium]|nr:glycoside hydrolase family 9 protein [Oscillospiraceae bacterium]